jgi:hypothetical protein
MRLRFSDIFSKAVISTPGETEGSAEPNLCQFVIAIEKKQHPENPDSDN